MCRHVSVVPFFRNAMTRQTCNEVNLNELSKHAIYGNCWIAIEGSVYDISSYVDQHPGGDLILAAGGTDATVLFNHYHIQGDTKARSFLDKLKIGVLVESKSPIMGDFYNTLKRKVAQKLLGISPRPWRPVLMYFVDTLGLLAIILLGVSLFLLGLRSPFISFSLPLLFSIANTRVAAQSHAVTHMQVFTKQYVNLAINFIAICGSRSLAGYDLPDREVQIRHKLSAATRTEAQFELPKGRGPFEHQAIHHVREGTSGEGDQCHSFASTGLFRFNTSMPYKSVYKLQTNRVLRNILWFARACMIDVLAPLSSFAVVPFYLRIGIYHRVPARLIGAILQTIGLCTCLLFPAFVHFPSFLLGRLLLYVIGDFMVIFHCQHRWDLVSSPYDAALEWGKYHASVSASLWGEFLPWHPIFWGYGGGTCPSTLSYHLEHTLFPGISYTHLQLIAPVCEQVCKEFGVEYMKYVSLDEVYKKIDEDLIRAGEDPSKQPLSSLDKKDK
jgi:cytochrome b5